MADTRATAAPEKGVAGSLYRLHLPDTRYDDVDLDFLAARGPTEMDPGRDCHPFHAAYPYRRLLGAAARPAAVFFLRRVSRSPRSGRNRTRVAFRCARRRHAVAGEHRD